MGGGGEVREKIAGGKRGREGGRERDTQTDRDIKRDRDSERERERGKTETPIAGAGIAQWLERRTRD